MASLRPSAVAGAMRRVLLLVGISGLAGVLLAGLVLPVAGSLGLAARGGAEAFQSMPADFAQRPLAQRSLMLDSTGRVIATFYEENRVYVGLDAVAPIMRQAIVAIEDDRFYEHGPIDLRGTARAAVQNVVTGEVVQGGSTLTQQYVKRVRADQAETEEERRAALETSLSRKIGELRLAISAEKELTKDQILERYLNIAYFGGGAYGIETAARHFYSTTAAQLTLSQAATLAGLVQSPSAYDPERNPERALGRRNVVLTRMADLGIVTQADAAVARQEPLNLVLSRENNGCLSSLYPFYCDFVYRELLAADSLGTTAEEREQTLRRGGLTVTTSLDPKTQDAAQAAVAAYAAPTDDAVAAIGMVEPGTGVVKAIAHSRGYGEGEGRTYINYAVDADRGGGLGFQPGSTMKVFVLAAAVKQGIPLGTRITAPQTLALGGTRFRTCEGSVRADRGYNPKNSTGAGTFDLRTGTWRSINTFFLQLSQRTGLCDPWQIANQSGLTKSDGDPLQQVPSFTLGPDNVSPLSMAEAYATFAARGVHCRSVAVASITDTAGAQLAVPTADCNRVVEEDVADTVNSVLAGVVDGPDPGRTGARMSIGRPAAGKTGTTNGARAVWFSGYTPQLAASVVIGDPDEPIRGLDGITLNGVRYREACGGCIPGPLWKQAMQTALDGVAPAGFARPRAEPVEGRPTAVPDVRGLTVDEAQRTLTESGFGSYVAGGVASRLDAGLVVSTSPRAGSEAAAGGSIRIYVSG